MNRVDLRDVIALIESDYEHISIEHPADYPKLRDLLASVRTELAMTPTAECEDECASKLLQCMESVPEWFSDLPPGTSANSGGRTRRINTAESTDERRIEDICNRIARILDQEEKK